MATLPAMTLPIRKTYILVLTRNWIGSHVILIYICMQGEIYEGQMTDIKGKYI